MYAAALTRFGRASIFALMAGWKERSLHRRLAKAITEYDEAAAAMRSLNHRGAIDPHGPLTAAEVAEIRARDKLIAVRRQIRELESERELGSDFELPIG